MSGRIKAAAADAANSWWSVVLIAALTAFVVYQHWQEGHPTRPQPVHEGEQVRAISLRTMHDDAMYVDWRTNGPGTIIYVMSPDCVWCLKNMDAAISLYEQASRLGYRFIGVSLKADGLDEYVARYKIPYPIYLDKDRSAAKALKVLGTPETLVVSGSGIVRKALMGVYTGKNADDLGKTLGLKLSQVPAA